METAWDAPPHASTAAQIEMAKRNGPLRTVFYTNGDRYKGFWQDDHRHGLGKMVWRNRERRGRVEVRIERFTWPEKTSAVAWASFTEIPRKRHRPIRPPRYL